jgi:hypothetical protein
MIPVWKLTKSKQMTGNDKYRVVISRIKSSRFELDTIYNLKVYFRLHSFDKTKNVYNLLINYSMHL